MMREEFMVQRKIIRLIVLLGAAFLAASCGQDTMIAESSRDGHLDELTIKSFALAEKNAGEPVLKTSALRRLCIKPWKKAWKARISSWP
jgi:hypothetical protein